MKPPDDERGKSNVEISDTISGVDQCHLVRRYTHNQLNVPTSVPNSSTYPLDSGGNHHQDEQAQIYGYLSNDEGLGKLLGKRTVVDLEDGLVHLNLFFETKGCEPQQPRMDLGSGPMERKKPMDLGWIWDLGQKTKPKAIDQQEAQPD